MGYPFALLLMLLHHSFVAIAMVELEFDTAREQLALKLITAEKTQGINFFFSPYYFGTMFSKTHLQSCS